MLLQGTNSIEYALLLDALAPDGAASPEQFDWGSVRWDRLVFLAEWHRLGPMVFRYLEPQGRAPADAMADLRRSYGKNAAKSLIVGQATESMLAAWAAADVPAILLKGAALVETVYPDPALREMNDVDVLVPYDKMDAAHEALASLGYGPKRPVKREEEAQEWMRIHHRHDPALVDQNGFVTVELHHHIVKGAPAAHFDIADFWGHARPAVRGSRHLLPATEDLLLHACIHFTYNRTTRSHSYGSLAELMDMAWLIDREQIDWQALIDAARARRLESSVFLALFAADELGIDVPAQTLEALRPPRFDPRLGRRMVTLRVLRIAPSGPVRSLRKTFAPGRDALEESSGTDSRRSFKLVWAYLRRAVRGLRFARYVLREPRALLQDYRLNRQIDSLEHPKTRPG